MPQKVHTLLSMVTELKGQLSTRKLEDILIWACDLLVKLEGVTVAFLAQTQLLKEALVEEECKREELMRSYRALLMGFRKEQNHKNWALEVLKVGRGSYDSIRPRVILVCA
uniref:Uncharacterized protein n=1 Tax=Physcomitrium patens TaxID=3218 RepID=A0A2K1IM11_PHYPA|nr:hypothetical protein PHYPA_026628 [Physcomitrium patens]